MALEFTEDEHLGGIGIEIVAECMGKDVMFQQVYES